MKDLSRGEIIQLVTTAKLSESQALLDIGLGDRAIRNLITELETMGLIET